MNQRPDASEYAPAFEGYVSLVQEHDILAALKAQREELKALIASVPSERETFRYEPSKWSLRQVAGHVADAERVFGYRALAIARGDTARLPGFDEQLYVENANFNVVPLSELWQELDALRVANILMFHSLRPDDWARSGVANENSVTVRAIAYVLAGHARHHMKVLRERYL
ncbi:MAG TPA: DinB family protein [Thermoanaerobaculia bacterium]|nr:DinB family protein [Thermoanaerobaculia bacterium]